MTQAPGRYGDKIPYMTKSGQILAVATCVKNAVYGMHQGFWLTQEIKPEGK